MIVKNEEHVIERCLDVIMMCVSIHLPESCCFVCVNGRRAAFALSDDLFTPAATPGFFYADPTRIR